MYYPLRRYAVGQRTGDWRFLQEFFVIFTTGSMIRVVCIGMVDDVTISSALRHSSKQLWFSERDNVGAYRPFNGKH